MTFFFNKLILDFKFLQNYYILFINYIFNILSNLFFIKKHKNYNFFLKNYNKYKFNINLYNFIFNKNIFIDLIWLFLYSLGFKNKYNLNKLFRSNFRILNTKNNFYFNLRNLNFNKNYLNFLKNFNLLGYLYFWNAVKLWLIPLFLLCSIVYMFLVLKSLPFNKVLFAWIAILMFTYWLVSGFVFFFKK